MVHRTMGLPHKSEPKNSYCVIWDNGTSKYADIHPFKAKS